MLSEERNRTLTETGAGTPMGELMRLYWQPIAAVSELEEKPIKPVRLMGEDLTLFRDLSGHYGLVDRHCPHRRASLTNGYVEECGVRCSYHGWLFAPDGTCTERPFEDISTPDGGSRDRIAVVKVCWKCSTPRWAAVGVFGPGSPCWCRIGSRSDGRTASCKSCSPNWPCNWFQCQENSIDPVHF